VNRWSFLVTVVSFVMASPAIAQVVPDNSLNTTVSTSDRLNFTIGEGRQVGGNLFHSFRDFSIPTGGSASFNNAASIQNIIGRVTGGNISNIDGLIRANGSANLFLINPKGIIFGANASLNIGGSFVASTADRIRFADGVEFSTSSAQTPPLLTINTPIGLQYGSNPGAIRVLGTGNNLTLDSSFAVDLSNRPVGLQVNSRQTLALIGGDVTLQGGNLTASSGRIEIGSIRNGEVTLTNPNWAVNYAGLDQFGTVQLNQAASINTSGEGSGSIQIQGQTIKVVEGSGILSITQAARDGQLLILRSPNSIEISGTSPDGSFPSSIFSDVSQTATGNGGNVAIAAQSLVIKEGALISTSTLGEGNAGDLSVRVTDLNVNTRGNIYSDVNQTANGNGGNSTIIANRITLGEFAQVTSGTFGVGNGGQLIVQANEIEATGNSGFFVSSEGQGQGGKLFINAERLSFREGGQLSASAVQSGAGGMIFVQAGEIEVVGESADANASAITSQVFEDAEGKGGTITIKANRLSVRDGAFISSSTFGRGQSGAITIQASDIEVVGVSPTNPRFPSAISTAVQLGAVGNASTLTIATDRLQVRKGATISSGTRGSGRGGELRINASELTLQDRATITVSGRSIGASGNLEVQSRSVLLDRSSRLAAETVSGDRGNILLNARDLVLRRGSSITTSATGTATGGNININTDVTVLTEQSEIVARAVLGQGGNIAINADGLLQTPNTRIDASSELGINGIVQINAPDIDPSQQLAELPNQVIDASQLIANSCLVPSGRKRGTFVITGTGGLPSLPTNPLRSPFATYSIPSHSTASVSSSIPAEPTGFYPLENGQMVLSRLCS
jgi:filamentous hemagglutinin family protein